MKKLLLFLCIFAGFCIAQTPANQPVGCTNAGSSACTPFQPFQQPPYPQLAGLRVQVFKGTVNIGSLVVNVPTQEIDVTANATNYIYLNITTGLINVNGSGFPSTGAYPIATAVANATYVYTLIDSRPYVFVSGTGGGGGSPPGTPTGSVQANCTGNFCGIPNSVVNLTTGNVTYAGLNITSSNALTFAGGFNITDSNHNTINSISGGMSWADSGGDGCSGTSGTMKCVDLNGDFMSLSDGVMKFETLTGPLLEITGSQYFLNDGTTNTLTSTGGVVTITNVIDGGLTPGTSPICPSGAGGLFGNTNCIATANVNSSPILSANFNNTTPAAGTNGRNITWQASGSSVSAELVGNGTASQFLNGTGAYAKPYVITTVSGLASVPGAVNGTIATVTDGASASDCTTGGGSTVVNCQYNGSTWAEFVASSSGSAAFAALTTGTNSSAAMVVGSGASLKFTGPNPWYDVQANGATGNGSTDDSTAINATIAGATPGGTIFFPCGTYLFTAAQMNISNSVTIAGESKQCVTLKKGGNFDLINLNAANVTITGVTIAGQSASFTGRGISMTTSAKTVSITDNIIQDNNAGAIYGTSVTQVLVDRNFIYGSASGGGIFMENNTTHVNVTNNYIDGTLWSTSNNKDISFHSTNTGKQVSNIIVSNNNMVVGAAGMAMEIIPGGSGGSYPVDIVVSDNTCFIVANSAEECYSLSGLDNSTITGNIADVNGFTLTIACFEVVGLNDSTFTGNTCADSVTGSAMSFQGVSFDTITGNHLNTFKAANGNGFYFALPQQGLSGGGAAVTSCTTTGTSMTFNFTGTLNGNIFPGAYIYVAGMIPASYNTPSGILWKVTAISSSSVTATNSITTPSGNCTTEGTIGLGTVGNTITGNQIVFPSGASGANVYGLRLDCSFFAGTSCSGNTIANNEFTGTGYSGEVGIYVAGLTGSAADSNTLGTNSFRNVGTAIVIGSGSGGNLPTNTVIFDQTLTNVTTALTATASSLAESYLPAPFSKLAVCASGLQGNYAFVTDSSTNTNGATITGGGSNAVSSVCTGSNWVVTSGTGSGGGGSGVWSALTNATTNLTLANAGFNTTFNQTSAVPWLWANTTTATSGTTNASPLLELAANYYTGSVSAQDIWTLGSSLLAGTNGNSTLTFGHSGSTGAANVVMPGGLSLGGSSSVCGTASPAWCGTESALTFTPASTVDGCQMNSTSHAVVCSYNGSNPEIPALENGSFTTGHVLAVNVQIGGGSAYDIKDAGYSATAIPLADLANQAANTVLGNFTAGTASPTAASVASCSGNNDGEIYISGTGFGCNTNMAQLNVAETFTALQTFGAQASIATTAHGVLVSENTSPVVATTAGAIGTVLAGNGAGSDPAFTANPSISTLSVTAAGAASTPGLNITGTPYTGGTATTNFPQAYMNCTGSTAPSTFSTAGTFFGINTCSGFAGNLFDAHINGAGSVFSVSSTGAGTFGATGGTPTISLPGSTSGTATIIGPAIAGTTINPIALSNAVQAPYYQTTTNCSSSASPAVCGAAAAGSVYIPTGTTSETLVVNTTAVTANSQIMFYPDDTLGTKLGVTCNSTLATLVGGSFISARTAGTSFTITFNGSILTNGVCGSYLIIN